jgi:hypothetical protein
MALRKHEIDPQKGALLVGLAAPDGNYWDIVAPPTVDGYVLTADSTQACGVSWQPGGGGGFAAPAFTAFALSGQASPLEVGATLSGTSRTFTWTTSNSANVKPNTVSITDTTASTPLATGLANTGADTLSFSDITNNAPATQTWTIAATNTQLASFSRTYSVPWQWRVYAGTNSNGTLTANQIKALSDSSALQAGFAGTYSYASATGYKYFCYPDSMGSVSSFVDANTAFPVSMATSSDDAAYSNTASGWSYAIVSVTNANSVTTNYRVYRTQFSFSGTFSMRVS